VATRIGKFHLDPNEMRAVVEPLTSVPAQMKLGDYVLGEVMMIKPSMCAIEVLGVENNDRVIVGDTNGTLHVSKIARRYVKDVGNEYRLGDIVRAQVISLKPSVQLSTEETRWGCIKALCSRCRFGLVTIEKALECTNCGRREMRNLAPDYGKVQLPPGFSTLNNDA
jgi:exosome complex component CSL4